MVGVGLSRRDAVDVAGMFGPASFGLVRCCLRMHGAQVSQLRMAAMSSFRLVRPELCIQLLNSRYVRWVMVRLSFT
ncbi:hypothetical protein CFBP1590__5048 [Pseudomonas viridiflava]|uniref:Uncharacterized protein n=1 Tax=Pseudomonas viridiflava TaxID=33069 RepID=A0A1Y6JS23_PSEVI|nr:hypothetical protein CFBP1590__5048 [Pseudomonas viridiflava]